jgi:translation initiation factor IF-2
MSEDKQKKVKIYQIAKDLNISHEAVIDFLNEKGYSIKSHMSIVTDEMMNDITVRFRKDKDLAAIHKKKIREFKEKYRKQDLVDEEKAVAEKEKLLSEKKKKTQTESEEEIPVIAEEATTEIPAEVEVQAPVIEEPKIEGPVIAPVQETVVPETSEIIPVPEKPVVLENQVIAEPKATETKVVEKKIEPVIVATPIETKKPESTAFREKPPYFKKQPPRGKDSKFPPREDRRGGQKRDQKFESKSDNRPPQKQDAKRDTDGKVKPAFGQVKESGIPLDKDKEKARKRKRKKRGKEDIKFDKQFDLEELVRRKKKKAKGRESNVQDVEDAIKRTFAEMDESPVKTRSFFKKRKKKEREEEQIKEQEKAAIESAILRVTEFTSVNELARLMDVPVTEVIQKCISLGLFVSINQRLDNDTITLVADEFGYQVEFQKEYIAQPLLDAEDQEGEMKPRAPVVTIMGHVDHGKTSLLDYIRSSNVVAGESGGITQHIGAYKVTLDNGKEITFIDTPGHEAFTSMRARGAKITDIVILVVAADDSVMPQTVEAISHALAANVPIIVAINKIDKPGSNIERIKTQLSERGILVEDWGGKYQCVEISAKFGTNVTLLLEKILLEAEILDLKANHTRKARGVVIEAELDKGKGIIATLLVQKGTLYIGDPFIAGVHSGKVRAMLDERGKRVESAGPSTPIQVLGFDGIPQAGDEIIGLDSEKETKDISTLRQQLKREQDFRQIHFVTLDNISEQIKEGEVKELDVIIKGDVDGSVEALSDSLMKISNKEVKVRVVLKGVGNISESDVILASASKAIIIAFHIRPSLNARKLAEKEKVEIRFYNIIYDAINDVKSALEGLLNPEISEEILSTVEIRDIFKVPKVGTIAGCYVQDGKINRNQKVRLIRDGLVIHQGTISSLKRFKDDVREVDSGFECGIAIENYNDLKVGDTIESFKLVEKKRKLQLEKA